MVKPDIPDSSFQDADFRNILWSEVRRDSTMFVILTGISFLEITSRLYTQNLSAYYNDCDEVVDWLTRHWQPEEVEHGKIMRAYVNAAWPEFDWQRTYEQFYEEFEPYCATNRYQRTRALEMLARCVTETGAATFYKTIRDSTKEPVLKTLMDRMQRDEVRHYKYFLRYFRCFNEQEKNTKVRILNTVIRRSVRVHREDVFIACKYAYNGSTRCAAFTPSLYRRTVFDIKNLVRKYYPYEQAVKMLIQPLALRNNLSSISLSLLSHALRLSLSA